MMPDRYTMKNNAEHHLRVCSKTKLAASSLLVTDLRCDIVNENVKIKVVLAFFCKTKNLLSTTQTRNYFLYTLTS